MLYRSTLLMLLALCLAGVSLLQAGRTLPLPGSRVTVELLTNGDFEYDGDTNKIPDDWLPKNTHIAKSDKMKCEKRSGPIAHDGKCAFMFRGNPGGAASNIAQTLTDFSALTEGSTLEFTTYIDPRRGVPGTTFGKAQVRFSDGRKLTLKLRIPERANRGVDDYVPVTDSAVLEIGGATITRVKIKFSYNRSSGKFLIDSASLTVSTEVEVGA